jgi:hypothetical protein
MLPHLPPLARRLIGLALLAPLAAAAAWGLQTWFACDGPNCGDTVQGAFVLVLLTTPVAAAGVLALAWDLPRGHRLPRLLGRLLLAGVALCVLVLAGAAVAAFVDAIGKLTGEPNFAYVDQPGAAEAQLRGDGREMLVAAAFLTFLAFGAAVALRRAHRRLHTRG